MIEDISVNRPSKEEVQTAIKKLRNGKLPEQEHRLQYCVHMRHRGGGGRRRLRPKTTWRQTVEKERDAAVWRSWNEVPTVAAGRGDGKAL